MKEVAISKLKQMTGDEIKEGGCFRIIKDEEEIALVIVGAIQEMRDKIVAQASQIDLMRGK
jgi:hypothetical protein